MARESNTDKSGPDPDPPAFDPKNDQIASAVKRAYDDVAAQPLPENMMALLDALKNGKGPK